MKDIVHLGLIWYSWWACCEGGKSVLRRWGFSGDAEGRGGQPVENAAWAYPYYPHLSRRSLNATETEIKEKEQENK